MPGKSPDKSQQYFIAIIPPSPVYEEALKLKEYFRDTYNSKASLNSPPHVTLHMPFRMKEKKEAELIEKLARFAEDRQSFHLTLRNFSCFSPKVIFIDVETNPELHALQQELHRYCRTELNLYNATYKEQPFYPHLTLAFRDLKKPNFEKAWQEFRDKEYRADFAVDTITLLKHTGKLWKPFKNFPLATRISQMSE
ncbi:MAG TPA: RNA 2',3'-cyclic phosphodiesterase [Cyclobacteriaceae bacterium]|jgi:2'-5' RNA ligase